MLARIPGPRGPSSGGTHMRDAVLAVAAWIAGIAQILSSCLLVILWVGGLAWVIWNGSLIYVAAWVLFGPLLVLLLVSALRLPFVLLGLLLAALAGRRDEYLAFLARINDR